MDLKNPPEASEAVRPEALEGQTAVHASTGSARTVLSLLLLLATSNQQPDAVFASVRQEVYVSGTVQSFQGYTFSQPAPFMITEPGQKEIGTITVEGIYNGEYPWIMRIYTDNVHFAGVTGALEHPPAGGLVSKDGRFVIPLDVSTPNFGMGVWRRIPDSSDPDQKPYRPSRDPAVVDYTDCVLMGIDPRNAAWVAGQDKVLLTEDDNPLGDTTAPTPFEIRLRADIPPTAVQGDYEGFVYIEIVPAP